MPTGWREQLDELARNLWWSWDGEATALWASVDPFRWEAYGHNPVALLADVEPEVWETLVQQGFPDRVRAEIEVPVADRVVRARLWEVAVGRCRLLLLDTDHDGNEGDDRDITRELYGGDEWTRIRQEIVLGLGGVAALRRLAIEPAVYHLNEGHCAFVAFGLLAEGVALPAVRERCVFTTHTPVQR